MESQILRIYRQVPDVACKGLCAKSCGPILMSNAEEKRIANKHGSAPTWDESLTCTRLIDARCTIYEDRPMICRLFGAVRNLRCTHGCTPDKGFLPERAARKLMSKLDAL